MRFWIRTVGFLLLAAMLLAGCSKSDPNSRTDSARSPEETSALSPPASEPEALEIVPEPDLSAFAQSMQSQVAEELEELNRLLADTATPPAVLAKRFGRIGRIYHAYGLLDPATAAYRNAARLAPQDFSWPYLLGVAALTRGDAEEAERRLIAAHDLAPEDLPTMLRLGNSRFEANRLDEAEALFEKVLTQKPDSAAALLGRARVAAAKGDQNAAIEGFRRVLELDPEASSVRYLLGLAYQRAGDREAAEREIARRGVRSPGFEDPLVDGFEDLKAGTGIYFERGVRALGEKRYQESIAQYRAALEIEPENLTGLRGLGLALAADGRHQEAAAAFRRMLEIDPGHRLARMELGTTLLEAGDLDGAIASLEKAIETDPDFRQAHYNLAVAHAQAGRLQAAEAAFREVLRIDPRDRQGLYELAVVLDRMGRNQEAVGQLRRLLELNPSLGLARQRLGDLLARSDDPEGALEQYRAVVQMDAPDQEKALAHYQIGRILAARGDDEATIAEFRKALALLPRLEEARLGIGEALLRRQRFAEAAREFEQVVASLGSSGSDSAAVHARRRWVAALILDRQLEAARGVLEEGLVLRPRSAELAHDLARLLSTAPAATQRDGDRALALAEGAFQAEQSLQHAETLAMALAENQRFDEAAAWQRRLIEQARTAGLGRDVPRLQANLERYENRQPIRLGGQ